MARKHSFFRQDIQGLRALAVSYVVVGHLWPELFSGGYIGVDVFFVISGFLITSHLLTQAAEKGRVSLALFWGNRAIRILPAAILVLLFCLIGTWMLVPQAFWHQYLREIAAATIYLENWTLAADAIDYWAIDNSASPVRHYWSLSVEEQFYIAMPLVLVAALSMGHEWRIWYGLGLASIVVSSLGYSIWYTEQNPSGAYFVTTTRAWEFALGSLLALVAKPAPRAFAALAAWSGTAMIIAAGLLFTESSQFPGYLAILPVAGTVLVIWANHHEGVLGSVYGLKPVQVVGDLSYAIYLWHWPLIIFAGFIWLDGLSMGKRLALAVAAFVMAWLSTRFFEDPIRFEIVSWRSGRSWILAAIAIGMLTLILLSAGLWMGVERRSAKKDGGVPAPSCFGAGAMVASGCQRPQVMTPDVVSFVKDGGNRKGCWATKGITEPLHCTLGVAAQPSFRVAAIGDSHNNALIPAYEYVARKFGWTVDVYGKNGCYFTTAELSGYTPADHDECDRWRESLRKELDGKAPYDLLIVTHWEGSFLPSTNVGKRDEIDGLVEAWKTQIDRGTKVIALTDTPKYPKGTVECISTYQLDAQKECRTAILEALPKFDSNTEAAALLENATVIDTRRYFCSDTECLALIGGVPVLRDRHHITGTFAASIGPLLADDIASRVDLPRVD